MLPFKPSHMDVRRVSNVVAVLRLRLKLTYDERFPIIEFLEFEIPTFKQFADFRLVIGTDDRFQEGVLAVAKSAPLQIVVRERIYCDAIYGDTLARYALAHELGHVFLGHVANSRGDEKKFVERTNNVSRLEWEADEFASELLAPSYMLQKMTSGDVASKFAVSTNFAELRLKTIEKRTRSRNAGLLLGESPRANSLRGEFAGSPLYCTRPRFLDAIRWGRSPAEMMDQTLPSLLSIRA